MPKKYRLSKRHSIGFVRSQKHYKAELRRKANKEKRKQPKAPRKLLAKDPSIPHLDPQKMDILKHLMHEENITSTDLQKAVAERFAQEVTNYEEDLENAPQPIETGEDHFVRERNLRKSQFKQELKDVVEESDVIIEVLDARDPESTRNQELEMLCVSKKKPVVLLLNKIDLVPKEIIAEYLDYYRKLQLPAMLFKAPQVVAQNSVRYANALSGLADKSACVGFHELKRLLYQICASEHIIAGVCGYPNTGKSSVINAMANRPACQAAPEPGCTREMHTIYINNRLRLIDCPGVISDTRRNIVLREELLENPVGEIGRLMEMMQDISSVYQIYEAEFEPAANFEEQIRHFLFTVGKKLGRIKQGGIVDIEQVAVAVIRDWNRGVIPFYKALGDCETAEQVQHAALAGIDSDMLDRFNYDVLGHLASHGGLRLK